MGWLNAIPDKQEVSRYESIGSESRACEVPSCDSLLVNWFNMLGRGLNNGMGLSAFTFQELDSFSRIMNINLTPWESEQLIMMSREYCAMISIAKEPSTPNPWLPDGYSELDEARESVVRNGMKMRDNIKKAEEKAL